jgi:creatinine amidohydrolase
MTATTYMSVLHDIGTSLAAAGFKKLVLYNSHGGNTALNDVMARDLRAEFSLRTFHMSASADAKPEGLNPQEAKYGFHAGEWTTAVLLRATRGESEAILYLHSQGRASAATFSCCKPATTYPSSAAL